MPSSTALLNLRNKHNITYNIEQIRYLNRKEQQNLKMLSSDATSADFLIDSFKKRSDVAYLAVTYSPTEGLMLSMKNNQRKKLNTDLYLNRTSYDEKSLSTRKDLDQIYASSMCGKSGRLLLIFLFASSEELRMVRMFPEFCACDTTFGTNKQKKELFTFAFLDGNNTAFNGARAFIPNSQSWVFNVVFKHCLPPFWGDEVANRLRLMITDGCTQEYLAFLNNSGPTKCFPNSVHALCNFHLLIVGYLTHVKGTLTTSKCIGWCVLCVNEELK